MKTQDELGGGVCQVASTIYYCALMANQEIVERKEHRYLVTYVPKGMDATVYWGSLDFKFKNVSGYPMKIEANTENNCVNIKLLGTNETGEYAVMTYDVLGKTEYEDTIKVDLTKPPEYEEQTMSPYTGYVVQSYRNVSGALLDARLGQPVSAGCIRMRDEDVAWLDQYLPLQSTVVVY